MGWATHNRRTYASRLIMLQTDGTGFSPWTQLDEAVKWWQVLGSPSNAAYMVQARPMNGTVAVAVQVMAANQYRSDLFAGCPDLQVRIANGPANTFYLLSVQGEDLPASDVP